MEEILDKILSQLETGQSELTTRMEKGQAEIIDKINHMTVLMTEGFKDFRKDMKTFQSDVNADIDLLFQEVTNLKRKVNKLEQTNKPR